MKRRDRLIEIQLRTPGQQYWAEVVESTSSRTRINVKDGEGPKDLIDYFRVASDITWLQENDRPVPEDLSDELANLRSLVRHHFVSDQQSRRQSR